jgi:hypothetical protein
MLIEREVKAEYKQGTTLNKLFGKFMIRLVNKIRDVHEDSWPWMAVGPLAG